MGLRGGRPSRTTHKKGMVFGNRFGEGYFSGKRKRSPNLVFPGGSPDAIFARVIGWNSDTGLSRDSAGVVDVGNGTPLDKSGTLNAATYGAGALANGMTATTQATGDNSTKVATTAFVAASTYLSGTTASIGGSLLTGAGSCTTGTVTVTGVGSGNFPVGSPVSVSASDGSLPNGLVTLSAAATATNTVTVSICAIAAVTPAAKTYNVAVF